MKNRYILILWIISLWATLPAAQLPIPLAPSRPDTTFVHDVQLVDPWNWLKSRDDPALGQVLKAESRYTKAALKPARSLSKKLFKEFLSRIPKLEESAPYPYEGYLYFSRQHKKQAYPSHWRRAGSGKDELLLDENVLAKGEEFFALGFSQISPDGKTMAYSADFSGNERYQLFFKDLHSGKTKATDLQDISEFIWCRDGRHALITRVNERWQTNLCQLLDLKTFKTETLVQLEDAQFDLSLYSCRDRNYTVLLSESKNTNQAWHMDTRSPGSGFHLIAPARTGVTYYPDILAGQLYLQTDLWCPDGSIARCSLSEPGMESWTEIIPGVEGSPLSSFWLQDGCLAFIRRKEGSKVLRVYSLDTVQEISSFIPEQASDLGFWGGTLADEPYLYYSVESYLHPTRIFRYDLANGTQTLHYAYPLPKGYDPENYICTTANVTAQDGSLIPLIIIHRSDLDLSSPHPLWLEGYGAYGDIEDPFFWANRLSLLDREFIYAIAGIRGGGELGQTWYEDGKLQNKMNSFTDFIACLTYLQQKGFTTPAQTVIEGGSAGGLLMGAVTNLAPRAMRMVIASVPFVDLINTMLDDSLPLTSQEYLEWGDPHDQAAFAYMLSYSPYDNVRPADLPEMLISSGWQDTRVSYWEGLKWAQKLRQNNLGTSKVLYRLYENEGHTGSGDRRQSLKSTAETMAYVLYILSQ
ncbi:MAG: prolyl oligopeptidase family serine peptidase [Candidatus Cloacimonetes bacterium]|jgi:oligopeptidase B|nr:prolyl oligopeptidase family serine peptidase [Candidatus Cloacimonadota bacterium]MDY0171790.1 prolyl oligopeptidase family serine peptidase [Candidatus Cloacimonadaceae bacterium]